MVKVTNISNDVYKEELRGKTYLIRVGETIDVPPRLVLNRMIEDKRLKRVFVESDREWMIHDAPEGIRKSIVKYFGFNDWHQAMDSYFGGSESRKASRLMGKIKKPKIPKQPVLKIEPKKPSKEAEEYLEKEQKEADDPKLEPLPPKLDKLTVSKLKILLEERGLSTEGRKADLIKTLTEAE